MVYHDQWCLILVGRMIDHGDHGGLWLVGRLEGVTLSGPLKQTEESGHNGSYKQPMSTAKPRTEIIIQILAENRVSLKVLQGLSQVTSRLLHYLSCR